MSTVMDCARRLIEQVTLYGPDSSFRRILTVEVVEDTCSDRAPVVALLASIAERRDRCRVLQLREGLNRVGTDRVFGDYARTSDPIAEARQVLVVVDYRRAWVLGDHFTNPSFLLRAGVRTAPDPRAADVTYAHYAVEGALPGNHGRVPLLRQDSVELDWYGNRVEELQQGDVILGAYSALAFGWLHELQPVPKSA